MAAGLLIDQFSMHSVPGSNWSVHVELDGADFNWSCDLHDGHFQMKSLSVQCGKEEGQDIFPVNCPEMNTTISHLWFVNIGSGNGLEPSGNKPLPKPMLTMLYDAKRHH